MKSLSGHDVCTTLDTPLTAEHQRLGARLVAFGGWRMPLQYEGILAEHQATRQAVTVFDTCHMGRFLFEGPRAAEELSRLLSAPVRGMEEGRCRYGFLLNERGGILDDLILCRLGPERWLLVVNAGTRARDWEWIRARTSGGGAMRDATGDLGKLDVQGPRARDAVERVLGAPLGGLAYFRIMPWPWRGHAALISRSGYTGEPGYEVYAPREAIVPLWRELLAAGVKPAGLGARDTLRLEAGLPLYGHELTEASTPVEANLGRYASKAEPYVGREAVEERKRRGTEFLLVGIRVDGRQSPRHGHRLAGGGRDAGWVTSGSFAPSLGHAVGMAYVRTELAVPGARLAVAAERRELAATVTALPFYRNAAMRGPFSAQA